MRGRNLGVERCGLYGSWRGEGRLAGLVPEPRGAEPALGAVRRLAPSAALLAALCRSGPFGRGPTLVLNGLVFVGLFHRPAKRDGFLPFTFQGASLVSSCSVYDCLFLS